jgi:hypothetical protein
VLVYGFSPVTNVGLFLVVLVAFVLYDVSCGSVYRALLFRLLTTTFRL